MLNSMQINNEECEQRRKTRIEENGEFYQVEEEEKRKREKRTRFTLRKVDHAK